MNYWLVKTEPEEYSFDRLLAENKVIWDGVRNFQARNNLKSMKNGDQVFVYHSGKTREIVGIAEVIKEHYPDPADKTGLWVVVELKPVRKLNKPVTLAEIKNEKALSKLLLLKQSRLSVMPIAKDEFNFMLQLGNTKI